ncbi:MAG: tRNA preQ1(34) S-adenosylmethionine ribosyltransferase-isomerase QueA [Spirochaetae bacterium HGW-Spirochaetae-1]|jgi:S-adenosylmethionine:tRNA ribosyltransferase-isomerase|nr:MAG: tRNA preQ1(34) S-adenosylmethionine ribosyltransferase-isomerase QueA [Spirochaetae bacterium HGW-Spirochaetae-1]
MNPHYTLEDFNFHLPEELIAQYPREKRDESRLFVMDRKSSDFRHSVFSDLPAELHEGDILVFNDARVIPGRIFCRRKTGGKIEVILTRRINDTEWLVICNRTKRMNPGELLQVDKDHAIELKVMDRVDDYLRVECNCSLDDDVLNEIGEIPLPPYIKREHEGDDAERYQTVYARESGAVAAPTAGLHFTNDLMDIIAKKGIEQHFLTLHVSWGTFQPVRENDLARHKMHNERYILPEKTAQSLARAKRENRRIIAVGTTSLRVLESCYDNGNYKAGYGETEIFIYPPYKIKSIDALITNFHTPYSTLLMLVSAFAGYDKIKQAYQEAVRERYNFFSYGDAMIIT